MKGSDDASEGGRGSHDISGRSGANGTDPYAPGKIEILPPAEEKLFQPEHIRVKELCNSDLHPDISCCFVRVDPGVTTALHWLEVNETQCVISGKGRIELGGRAADVGPGWEIRIPRGTPQRITNIGPFDLVLSCICEPRFTESRYHTLQDAVIGVAARREPVAMVAEFGNSISGQYNGQVALVTGGSGGIGLELCRQLGRLGFTVYLAARDREKGDAAAASLRRQGLSVELLKLDVMQDEDIGCLAQAVAKGSHCLDVLVNCAGINLDGSTASGSAADIFHAVDRVFADTFAVNTLGPLRVIRALLPLMRKAPDGARIINVSSDMASLEEMDDLFPAYRISKTALNAETRVLAAALKNTRIVVNCVSPGWVKTRMGGPHAPDTVQQGVQAILWLATVDNPPTGGFFCRISDRQPPEGMVEIARVPW
jgi:NAD(P)-dependent dehydrogenase (short-subunit alcohol dehydrogenase family)/mannose-6-phosphate isomerase-like protein (cupin superfamily)